MRNAGENEPVTSESDEGSFPAVYHSPDDVFDALLDTVVVPDPDGLLTTYDVWVQWATQHGADPGLTEIAGIKRGGSHVGSAEDSRSRKPADGNGSTGIGAATGPGTR